MKKLSQEDDLTLLNQLSKSSVGIPSYMEILFFSFMIILYYSGYARWFFWVLIIGMIIAGIDYMVSYSHHKTKEMIIKDELRRRGIIL